MEKEPQQQERPKTPGEIIDEVMDKGNFVSYAEGLLQRDSSKLSWYETLMLAKEIYNFLDKKDVIIKKLAEKPEEQARMIELFKRLEESNAMKEARRPFNP